MQITPNEIDSIEEAGMLDNEPVKMIRTKGGFWICVGKPMGKSKEEALSAGSHPAIVKYNVQKAYPGFQPSLMKSESSTENTVVDKHSHFLSEDLRKSGHDIYSIQKGNLVDFQVTKNNIKISSVKGNIEGKSLAIKSLDITPEFSRALAGATAEKALSCGAVKIKIDRK